MPKRGTGRRKFFRERGQGLFILLALLLVVIAGLIFSLARPATLNIASDKQTIAALAQAKDALIGWAANDNTIPGSLPCPDTDNSGNAQLITGSNCPSYIGRLPWRTLGLSDLRDGGGERLWYALSPNFRNHTTAQPVNSDTTGQLAVTGTNPASNVIAIIFATGPALGSQKRDSAQQNNPANYLEGGNESGNYVTGPSTDTFNDRLLTITSDDLFPSVELRVTQEIRFALQKYYQTNQYYPYANDYTDMTYNCTSSLTTRGRLPLDPTTCAIPTTPTPTPLLPWPASGSLGALPGWFAPNKWNLLVYYTVAPACTFTTPPAPNCSGTGFITVKNPPTPTNTNVQALVIAGGRALAGLSQLNPCGSVKNCIESIDSSNPPDGYINSQASGTFNDKMTIVGP